MTAISYILRCVEPEIAWNHSAETIDLMRWAMKGYCLTISQAE